MATAKLTKSFINGVKQPAKGELLVWDTELTGFGLRVATDRISFIVQGRIGRGRGAVSRRWTIGPYGEFTPDEARQRARELLRDMRTGINPREVAQQSAAQNLTVGSIAEEYLRVIQLGRHTRTAYEKIVAHPLTDLGWIDRSLASITRDEVIEKYVLMRDVGLHGRPTPDYANHTFDFLRALFHHAMDKHPDTFKVNPVKVLKRIRAKPKARTRHIPEDKLGAVWSYLEEARKKAHNSHTAASVDLVAFLLLTGARKSEGAELTWDRVNLEEGWWHLPTTKNGSEAKLPLSTQAAEVLKRRPSREGYVFASYSVHIKDSREIMKHVSRVAGCTLSPHDLRRTFSQVGTRLCGIDSAKVARLTCHVLQGVFGINYDNNPDMRHFKPAVQQIADRICSGT